MFARIWRGTALPAALLAATMLGGCYAAPAYGPYGSYYPTYGYGYGAYGYPGYIGTGIAFGGWGWGYHPGWGYGYGGGWYHGGWHGGWGGYHGGYGGGFHGSSLGSHGGVGNAGTWHH